MISDFMMSLILDLACPDNVSPFFLNFAFLFKNRRIFSHFHSILLMITRIFQTVLCVALTPLPLVVITVCRSMC